MKALPIIRTLRSSTKAELTADLIAGLTTAVMLVPQAMAYAMLAGLDPIVGLYASTVPLVLYALIGSSRRLSVGPVAMDSLMVAAGLLPLVRGDAVQYAASAAALALMVGAIQLLLGALRAGALVRFLSGPVIIGFTSAAAVIIAGSQLKHALGLSLPRSSHIVTMMSDVVRNLGDTHRLTVAIAIASTVTLVVLKMKAPRFPRFLLVVAAGTVITAIAELDQFGLAVVGQIPAGLPPIGIPKVDLSLLPSLFPVALSISLVSMMEGLSIAKRYDDKTLIPSREFFGIGLANIGAGLVSGYPVSGGFSRTAVNVQAGARSPLAGIITASLITATLLFLTPLFRLLPLAVLASIILTAIVGLVDIGGVRNLWKTDQTLLAVATITFLVTLGLGIPIGMGTGIATSLAVNGWRYRKRHHAVPN
ncbi:MAG: SulP family sulfate permease [Myxococcota bacterium]|jgi:SulP family sulfate permease